LRWRRCLDDARKPPFPSDNSIPRGQRHDSRVPVHCGEEAPQPASEWGRARGESRQGRTSTVHHELAKIFVAPLGDAGKAWPTARGDLSGNQAEPRGQISSLGEGCATADGCDQCCRIEHANAGDRRQAPTSFIAASSSC